MSTRQSMPTFIKGKKDLKLPVPLNVRVFTDYDKLDAFMKSIGYETIETTKDEKVDTLCHTGFQNESLHSGWIATMGDSSVSTEEQITLLEKKVQKCIEDGEDVAIGFCQTGNFSVGYTIYRKPFPLENDNRVITQTQKWRRLFKTLRKDSSENLWAWLIGNYSGDQDDLDHLFNERGLT